MANLSPSSPFPNCNNPKQSPKVKEMQSNNLDIDQIK